MPPTTGKRRRDPLGERVRENRYKARSQTAEVYLNGSLSLNESTPSEVHARVQKAVKACAESHGTYFTPQKINFASDSSSVAEVVKSPDYYKARRMSIYYQFLLYGAPEEEQWEEMNLVSMVMQSLFIPTGSSERVVAVLRDCLQSIHDDVEYNPNANYSNNGAEPKVKEMDKSAQIIYEGLENGLSIPQFTSILNLARRGTNEEAICCTAVRNFIMSSEIIKRSMVMMIMVMMIMVFSVIVIVFCGINFTSTYISILTQFSYNSSLLLLVENGTV